MNILNQFDTVLSLLDGGKSLAEIKGHLLALRKQIEGFQKTVEAHTNLQDAALKQTEVKETPDFEAHMGVMWKRIGTGNSFDPHPYCAECSHHPAMTPRHQVRVFVCSNGHLAPLNVYPPLA